MLKILRRIIQEFNAAPHMRDALQLMVMRIREAMETQACSIFLVDTEHKDYVLMATDGLNPEAIGQVHVPMGKGLVGLVGKREEPINVEDAPTHPQYLEAKAVGEEKFKAFLGVPIINSRQLLGVLIVQQEAQRRYDEAEEAFLITLAAQLASALSSHEATRDLLEITQSNPQDTNEAATLHGLPSVPGVGLGTAVVVYPPADLEAVPEREASDLTAELAAFSEALMATQDDIKSLSERLAEFLPPEEQALFDVYLRILESSSLLEEVTETIETDNVWAQTALQRVIKKHVHQFEAMEDAYLRERAADIRDLGRRVLAHLQSQQTRRIDYPEQTILVGEEVTPAALAEVPEGHLVAVVSTKGSSNSHVAILARALGVPTVMGVSGANLTKLDRCQMVVDGYYGHVYVSPSMALYQEFAELAQEERELDEGLEALRTEPAETPDGYRVQLMVNTGLAADAGRSLSVGAEGVGLYRTEVPFMVRDRFPAEEEQYVIYRQLLKVFAPRTVTMRTLDVGGDKTLPYFPVEEENPFLGWRGIRLTLDHPELFLVQIRAMLRASESLNNLRIMLPMITDVSEVEEAQALIHQAHNELQEEGFDIQMPEVGVMIEVPSAVYQARELARRVDFMSVGSNDLAQYILAVDRNNSRVANLYSALHPAVLRALKIAVEGAHQEGRRISICGEMAGDPGAVILLIAMGFDALSMNSSSLPRMKWVIRNVEMRQARQLLSEVMTLDNARDIRERLDTALDESGLGGLIRAGKH